MNQTILLLSMLFANTASATDITISPYLQSATTDAIWVLWETNTGSESTVEWGTTKGLGSTTTGTTQTGDGISVVHEVQLTGLSANTKYYYRTVTSDAASAISHFVTPPEHQDESSFSIVAVSDMQNDYSNPTVFDEIIHDGVIETVTANWGADMAEEIGLVMIPGDLVDNGWIYSQWRDTFFDPASTLMAQVPFYPVPGNHEANSPYFFNLFHLPENGSDDSPEHWWWTDYGNLRIVGLDSNWPYTEGDQLEWLRALMDETCAAEEIDFVFAQLHHPYKSELWIAGELDFTGEVIDVMQEFTTDCGKPSLHFFGHTHGYSRGQSQDHRHLWVNVATAGGNIDYWGEYAQNDYDEFTVSQDEWGFVVVDVEAGEDPSFLLQRFSRGNEYTARDNELRDEVLIHRYDAAPVAPEAVWPAGDGIQSECFTLTGNAFSDPDKGLHGATQWQIALTCDDFETPILDTWVQHENQYGGTDLQAGDDLTDQEITNLTANTDYCWRLRYRDRGLNWSDWSSPTPFTTSDTDTETVVTDELLLNTGAEDGLNHWTLLEGGLESLTDGECNGVDPHTGNYYFAIGGICEETPFGWARQSVDVSAYTKEIDAGMAWTRFGGWMRNYSGSDNPAINLVFEDGSAILGESDPLSSMDASWTEYAGGQLVPVGTRTIHLDITGTRNAGADNDSYVDDVTLTLDLSGEPDCQEAPKSTETTKTETTTETTSSTTTQTTTETGTTTPTDTTDTESTGCGCRTTYAPRNTALGFLLLPMFVLVRREKQA